MAWDPETFGLDGSYTASPTLGADDPLRSWAQQLTPEDLAKLQGGNAQEAIDNLISRGVPPPPSQIMSFASPGWETRKEDFNPTETPPEAKGFSWPSLPSIPKYSGPTGPDGFPVFKNGKLQGNLTSGQGVPPTEAPQSVPLPQPDPRKAAPVPSFDPEPDGPDDTPSGNEVPLPRPRPPEAGPGASDISAQAKTKPKAADALDGFAKSLAGVKAPTAPPLNAVGTPAAPHPSVIQAPNVASLLQLIGQQSQPSVLQTLGRLLVAGKA